MRKPTYYDVLGISRSASDDEIERAYRQRVLERHPDRHPADLNAHADMQQLAEAASTLRSTTRRRAYDQALQQSAAPLAQVNWLAGDVVYSVTVSPAAAEAGTRHIAQFHSASGEPYHVAIELPPGVTHGTRIVLPGVGGPAREGGGRGDLIVDVRVG